MTPADALPSPPPAAPPAPPSAAARSSSTASAGTVRERGAVLHDSVRCGTWSLRGTAKVTGPVEVGTADLRGALVVGGKLSADGLRSRGDLEVEGPVEVRGRFSGRGTVRLAATVHAGDLDLEGMARCGGAVTVDRTCSARGGLHAPSLTAEVLTLEGSAQVPGEIEARSVDARFREPSRLGHVSARTVRLRGQLPNLVDRVFFHERTVVVGRIDAEAVELTGVEAGLVRAQRVVLGRGCHVTTVDGTVVSRHPSSSIGPESKSPPPYGLRR